ncbi:MAG: putative metal-binding motif-containing protein [Myxococcota bacterium]
MSIRHPFTLCVIVGCFVASGCGSATAPGGDTALDAEGGQGASAPASDAESQDAAVASPDPNRWGDRADTGVTEADVPSALEDSAVTDAGGGDPAPSDTEDTGPCPGCFGAPCEEDLDCNSGWCVEGPDGAMCTKTCSADCPELFSCQSVSAGGDPVYICIYDHIRACRPCDDPADCVHPLTANAAACIEGATSADGAFCATPCGGTGLCPSGMVCEEVEGESVCLPGDGTCTCSDSAIAEQATTSCAQVNDAGSCDGARVCLPEGLTACDAAMPLVESCNEVDDDCDGVLDEGFEEVGQACDGDDDDACLDGVWGCTAEGLTCDDNEASMVEVCDTEDNDCDGEVDEGFEQLGEPCDGNDEDLCTDGAWICSAQGLECDDDEGTAVEQCNGLDDDCDGETDEAFATLGDACDGEDADLCTNGVVVCAEDGAGVSCEESDLEVAEVCNTIDDDCDGAIDEGIEGKDTPCDGDDADLCTDGTWICTLDGLACDDSPEAVVEVCDEIDNDCDGEIDEDFEAKGSPCDGNDEDLCLDGVWACEAQGLACNDDASSSVETCNGLDDDCDDSVDETFPTLGGACDGEDSDLCANGELVCANDSVSVVCLEAGGGIVESCNGLDDDCDGVVPDDEADSDGDGVRVCGGDCNDLTGAIKPGVEELCNAIDDDCDSATDEAFKADGEFTLTDINGDAGLVLGDGCGVGACTEGTVVCGPGGDALACTTHVDASVESCDAEDNDCDGEVDETFKPGGVFTYEDIDGTGVPLGEPCGFGACAGGEAICTEDGDAMTCSTLGAASNEVCNGTDDDCDGTTDEGTTLINDVAALSAAGCKVAGVCGQPGVTMATCEGGAYSCAYSAPNYQVEESFCDSGDNDCDGLVDESLSTDWDGDGHYLPGSCAVPADDCDDTKDVVHPAYPETCDGVDNNCDNIVDPPGSALCTTLYQDGDGDNYGSGLPSCRCDTSGGWTATTPGDCYEDNAQAKPGQTSYFSSDRGDGSYDYNCDGQETKEGSLTTAGNCAFFSDVCSANNGWAGGPPACGQTGTWQSGCKYELKWPLSDSGCHWSNQTATVVKCR